MQRQSRGEPPLPEEDLSKLFKPHQPPARMESLLIAGTVSQGKAWLVFSVLQKADDHERLKKQQQEKKQKKYIIKASAFKVVE